MFNRGVNELLSALPLLTDLSLPGLRRMLTRAWLEATDRRQLGGPGVGAEAAERDMRRLVLQRHLACLRW